MNTPLPVPSAIFAEEGFRKRNKIRLNRHRKVESWLEPDLFDVGRDGSSQNYFTTPRAACQVYAGFSELTAILDSRPQV